MVLTPYHRDRGAGALATAQRRSAVLTLCTCGARSSSQHKCSSGARVQQAAVQAARARGGRPVPRRQLAIGPAPQAATAARLAAVIAATAKPREPRRLLTAVTAWRVRLVARRHAAARALLVVALQLLPLVLPLAAVATMVAMAGPV